MNNKTNKEIVAWSCYDDIERLEYDDIDEAIEQYLDTYNIHNQPDKIIVYGYAELDKYENVSRYKHFILANLLELLDEDYNDESTKETEEMENITNKYILDILDIYKVKMCELVKTIEINVKEWINK